MKGIAQIVVIVLWIAFFAAIPFLIFELRRRSRKKWYNEEYLNSEAWRRKRALVLKRDNWKCVYCGAKATRVHHKQYAKNIGREPIEWLEAVCDRCHEKAHAKR